MAVTTVLLDFKTAIDTKNYNHRNALLNNIENIIRDYLENLKLINTLSIDTALVKFYSWDNDGTVTLKIYGDGFISLNIEYKKKDSEETVLSFENTKRLEKQILKNVLDIHKSFTFVPIKRGSFMKYFPTSDDRLLEYDVDAVVFEERSPFQKVQIVHSKSLGNMLVLDDLQNISEADLVYTETLMGKGKENYRNKEILILGGGDGGLLYELLKEGPKQVIMLEIDEVVVKACSKYMRSVCGEVLDTHSGPNYSIIIGDCMKSLQDYIKQGKKFDYIFGDLTDVPISDTPSGKIWDFISKILEVSFKLLEANGKFMTHLTGSESVEALKMYESEVLKINPNAEFSKTHAFIPSFFEDWVFGQISLK